MQTLSYTKARQNFADLMKSANADHTPFHVTQKSGDDVVIVSKADYDSLQETMYLLSSPANAKRLNESIAELESGSGTERELADA
ncbi:MAG: type II toxin-antitoxin system prevent-host-death family antitoxin [Kordiimonas sp.]|nr:type II toxin-antitoxin system prevent-host-death family antitoxin [Kordiimonas sp.]|tara:strand:- start:1734 stop:1988 length:255 start_codon:yes stop_codon:yes gene_type:complete